MSLDNSTASKMQMNAIPRVSRRSRYSRTRPLLPAPSGAYQGTSCLSTTISESKQPTELHLSMVEDYLRIHAPSELSSSYHRPSSSVPAPRLVGIHPNPGPAKGKKGGHRKGVVTTTAKHKTTHKVSSVPRGDGITFQSVGSKVGDWLGKRASNFFSTVLGGGDYKVSTNSFLTEQGPPMFNSSDRKVRVSHREFIGDVSGSTAFTTQYLIPLNPGISQFMPWGSFLSDGFEQYRILGCVFEFKSTSADALNSTNTALGTVIMCTEYNSNARPFQTKMEMENHQFCVSTKPSNSALHPIECAPNATSIPILYIRDSATLLSQSSDRRLYDLGFFQLSTVGMQAAAVIGELWISYDIELIKPQLIRNPAVDACLYFSGITPTQVGTIDSTNFFGAVPANLQNIVNSNKLTNGSTIVPQWLSQTTLSIGQLSPGAYIFRLSGVQSNVATTVPSLQLRFFTDALGTTTNCDAINLFEGYTSSASFAPTAGATTTRWSVAVCYKVKASEGVYYSPNQVNSGYYLYITAGTLGTVSSYDLEFRGTNYDL